MDFANAVKAASSSYDAVVQKAATSPAGELSASGAKICARMPRLAAAIAIILPSCPEPRMPIVGIIMLGSCRALL